MVLKRKFAIALYAMACLSTSAIADGDQHSVDAVIAALNMPIPADVIAEAQKNDDSIMQKGDLEGQKVYLVTDARLSKLKGVVSKILSGLDKDQRGWVVRVLDTSPKTVNAFVTGGKYIYVYTGLIERSTSDDELAFILSHEIGHSFLKHNLRKESDESNDLKNILVLGALLSKKHSDKLVNAVKIMDASYSQKDEEEADAIAVILAKKAGYDPMRGVDFFSRSKRDVDDSLEQLSQEVEKQRPVVNQHQQVCNQLVEKYKSSASAQQTLDPNKINAYCAEAEKMRVSFNELVNSYNNANKQKASEPFYSSHPVDQSRIAAIAAAVDYFDGVRTVDSLSQYEQTQRVYQGLIAVQSSLMAGVQAQNGK